MGRSGGKARDPRSNGILLLEVALRPKVAVGDSISLNGATLVFGTRKGRHRIKISRRSRELAKNIAEAFNAIDVPHIPYQFVADKRGVYAVGSDSNAYTLSEAK